jgi:hypothetical protein
MPWPSHQAISQWALSMPTRKKVAIMIRLKGTGRSSCPLPS